MIFLQETFNQKLQLILIENLVIGSCLLIIGLFAKSAIERVKSRQSLEAELNKLRVDRIGECWAVHSKYGMLLDEFISSLDKYRFSKLTDQEIVSRLSPKIEELKKVKVEVEIITASHRFWLGEEIHTKATEFNKSFPDFCDVFHSGKFDRCKELKVQMIDDMIDVDDVVEMLHRKKRNPKLTKRSV